MKENKEILKEINNRTEKYYNWFKHVISMAATLFGVLIALNKAANASLYFKLAISLLGVGIITGVIVLFSEVKYHENKIIVLQNRESNISWRTFQFFEISSLICFALAILLFILSYWL